MKIKEKNLIWLVLLITLVVLVLPFLIRWLSGNQTLAGDFSYHHLLISENKNLLWESNFFTPYDLVLFGLNSIIRTNFWSVFLPILFGLGSVLLFYELLKKTELKTTQKFLVIFLLVFSSAFIYFFTFSNQNSLAVFLLLLIFNLLNYKKLRFLAFFAVLILPFFDILTTLITLLFLLAYSLLKKEKFVYYLMGGLVLMAFLLQFFYPQPLVYEPKIINWTGFFSDLGGLAGFDIFFLVLGFLGIMVTWKKRRVYYLSYPLLLLLIIFSFSLSNQANLYLNFILALFASEGLFWLWQRNWKISFLRRLSISILIAGIIFSSFWNVWGIVTTNPNGLIEESLVWLRDNREQGVVLSPPGRGFWIEQMAGKKSFINYYSDNFEEKSEITQIIFNSRELRKTLGLLEENKIKYIWIDQQMRRGEVWLEDDDGLLFLLRNERFKNVYNKKGIEIWEFR